MKSPETISPPMTIGDGNTPTAHNCEQPDEEHLATIVVCAEEKGNGGSDGT